MYVFSYRLLKGFTVSVKITILEIGGFQISLRSLYKTCVKTSLYVIAFWWKGINFFMNYPRTHILEVKKKNPHETSNPKSYKTLKYFLMLNILPNPKIRSILSQCIFPIIYSSAYLSTLLNLPVVNILFWKLIPSPSFLCIICLNYHIE